MFTKNGGSRLENLSRAVKTQKLHFQLNFGQKIYSVRHTDSSDRCFYTQHAFRSVLFPCGNPGMGSNCNCFCFMHVSMSIFPQTTATTRTARTKALGHYVRRSKTHLLSDFTFLSLFLRIFLRIFGSVSSSPPPPFSLQRPALIITVLVDWA